MRNENGPEVQFARMYTLQAQLGKAMVDGKRDPLIVANRMQELVEKTAHVIHVDRAQPFNLTSFLPHQKISVIEVDERNLLRTEVDLKFVGLQSFVQKEDGLGITGVERIRRAKQARHVLLDAQVGMTLWHKKSMIPSSWSGPVCFDGTIFARDGEPGVFCLTIHKDGIIRHSFCPLETRCCEPFFSAVM